ncbi:MAG: bifunctional (p)ppGpp synthetase/guanosine-3',5'-bis(diphosphate) 3'-pyrophosphohydrolase [Defluviitaleaceae bacterium]|nr:bifunctional (p)ppGpp synthetase/guanosine-3',5'-bis(diphosphate) 3'-pyrophosphohydrolase [Defluviitaleaceae bacterium]
MQVQNVSDVYKIFIQKIQNSRLSSDTDLIKKALDMAHNAHKEQFRKSGENYIIHPIHVAIILLELGMDTESIVAGLLHDTIEDTTFTYEYIENHFGKSVANLVNGVTKLLQIEYKKDGTKNPNLQAENYRKMFLAMTEDVRVIVIKMADRLHNMRTLNYMTEKKQRQKAQETLDIYAPLARRLGISKIRNELEDLSLRYLEPESYYNLASKIKTKQTERQNLINDMIEELKLKISNSSFMQVYNCNFDIQGRPKHFFSIYKKMKTKNMSLEQIYDLFALRIIVDTDMQCYGILGVIHENYHPLPDRFKDYISVPKSNGYKSLHTTIIGKNGEPFEIQIRTSDMHEIAEYGIAAHWKYKEKPNSIVDRNSDDAKISIIGNSLKQILELQAELSKSNQYNDEEYLEELKTELDVYKSNIYCYTPTGDVIELKADSTPIDFAYAIHSVVGNTLVGAKVNSVIVPIDYKLSIGDRVEILTSRNSTGPKEEWLNFVKTSQARSRIRAALKINTKEEYEAVGREMLEIEAKRLKQDLSELLNETTKEMILSRYNYTAWDLFLAAIGRKVISEVQVIKRLLAEKERREDKERKQKLDNLNISDANLDISSIINTTNVQKSKTKKTNDTGVIVEGLGDIDVRFSKCCSPLPGDDIVGFITRGRGVSVHRTDCKNIISMPDNEKPRLIKSVFWNTSKNNHAKYSAELSIEAEDRAGVLVTISSIISENRINIKNLNIKADGQTAYIICILDVESKEQLDKLCDRILNVKEVQNIKR